MKFRGPVTSDVMRLFSKTNVTQTNPSRPSILLIAVLLFGSSVVTAQRASPKRVKFPRGRTTVVLKGSIVNDRMNQYLLAARVGQTMTVHITSRGRRAKFDVYPVANRSAFENSGGEDTTDWQGVLPESGDYIISVYSTTRSASYTLEITIR